MPLWWPADPNKMRKGIAMENNQQVLEYIVKSIKETGNDPRTQIRGYVISGNDCYITRTGNARRLIKSVETSRLEQYVAECSAVLLSFW